MINTPITATISDADWTLISLGDQVAYGYSAYAVDSNLDLVPWYVNTTTASGSAVPVPAVAITYGGVAMLDSELFYAKTTSGSATLVIIPGNKSQV